MRSGAAAAALVVLASGVILWTRSGPPRDDASVPATRQGVPPAPPFPGQDARPGSVAASPEVKQSLTRQPEVPVPPAPAAPSPAEDAVNWERIPLDRAAGESLGDPQTRKAFSAALRQRPALSRCTEDWTAPPGLRHLDLDVELRVRSVDDALVVEDVTILDANVSDASVERCVISELRGRRAPAPGIRPGQAFRIKWGARKYLR